jgi:hypothetical protein
MPELVSSFPNLLGGVEDAVHRPGRAQVGLFQRRSLLRVLQAIPWNAQSLRARDRHYLRGPGDDRSLRRRASYMPPDAFLEALRSCSEMGSDAYFAALVEQGGVEFAHLTQLIKREPTPCPHCGSPLLTPPVRVVQMDWHDPDHPKKLRPIGTSES